MTRRTGLGNAGKRLRKVVLDDLPEGWELDARELELLELACRQADDLAGLEGLIRKHGRMVPGSQGQPVLNPAISEARQARAMIEKLLGRLAIPDDEGVPRTAASERAQAAAQIRWNGQRGRTRAPGRGNRGAA